MRREEEGNRIENVRGEGIREATEILPVRSELQGDDEGSKQIKSILDERDGKSGWDWRREGLIRTLRKGLPRFVVFIMCDEVAAGASTVCGMAGDRRKEREEEKDGGDGAGRRGGEGGGGRRAGGGREEESGEKMRTNDDKRGGGRLDETR